MLTIKQPSKIILGKFASSKFNFPDNCLLITSKGATKRGWIDYLNLKNVLTFINLIIISIIMKSLISNIIILILFKSL